jgi:hypothetical protein
MKKSLALLSLLALLIAGCVRSFYPLYTDKDLTFDPTVIGTWIDNDTNVWTFLKSNDKSYELIYTEKNSPAKFKAHLVKLGKHLFLDLAPGESGVDNSFFSAHLIPVHTFSRIWVYPDSMQFSLFDNAWLSEMIKQQRISIAHERQGDGIILTAPTKELQKLVTKYAENKKAFPEPGVLHRKK